MNCAFVKITKTNTKKSMKINVQKMKSCTKNNDINKQRDTENEKNIF